MTARLLISLVHLLFGYTQIECDVCGWPYRTGVNSNGQCYLIREGLQGGLDAGCYVWCDAWARQSGVQQPATPVLSFWSDPGGAYCKCQRLESTGEVGYQTRPNASCDFAYSDELQGYYDSIAVRLRNERNVNIGNDSGINVGEPANVTAFFQQVNSVLNAYASAYGAANVANYNCMGGFNLGYVEGAPSDAGTFNAVYILGLDAEYNQHWTAVKLPPGYTCADFGSGRLSNASFFEAAKSIADHQVSQDTAIKRVNEAIETIQAGMGSNTNAIMTELGRLMSKPTGGANLNPVLDAIQEFHNSQNAKLATIDSGFSSSIDDLRTSFEDAIDSLRGSIQNFGGDTGKSTDVSGVEKRQDTTNARLTSGFKGMSDSISGVKTAISNLDSSIGRLDGTLYRLDSAQRNKWDIDRVAESLAYRKAIDSMGIDPTSEAQVRQGIQDAQGFAVQGEANVSGLKTALQGWQNLPGTCLDAPTLDIDLTSSHLGVVHIEMGKYTWVTQFSRLGMRFMGIGAALLIILRAMELLGYSNAKKD